MGVVGYMLDISKFFKAISTKESKFFSTSTPNIMGCVRPINIVIRLFGRNIIIPAYYMFTTDSTTYCIKHATAV